MGKPETEDTENLDDSEPIEPEFDDAIEENESRQREELLPMVAIVGRPNVGKSTLFNRLAGRRDALVHEMPGMTRDRRIQRVEWGRRGFLCVDTGGFDIELEDPLLQDVAEQATAAMEEADVIVLMVVVDELNHPADQEMFRMLRKSRKPVLLIVNRCDNEKQEMQAQEFFKYGFDELFPISAMHGRNITPMMERIMEKIDALGEIGHEYVSGGIAVAVVGRQNVGKSTMINRLLGEERMIASSLPGTTRDSIDTIIKTEEGDVFTLIDTAGIRRRGKVERGVERLTVMSSMISIRRANVAIIVVDGTAGLTAQDAHIAGYCVDEGCACIVAVNKWDIVEKDHKTADKFTKSLQREWGFMKFAPILYVSALTGQRMPKMFDLVKQVYDNGGRRIPTPLLNNRLMEWVKNRPPAIKANRRPKIKYVAQTGTHPPTFTFFANDPEIFHFSYKRYLINCIRGEFDFEGTPIRTFFRARKSDRNERD